MEECPWCRDLNEEKERIYVSEIKINGWAYNFGIPIIHCPVCGKILRRYDLEGTQNESEEAAREDHM